MTAQEGDTDKERDLAGTAMSWIDQVVDTLHDKVIRPILLVGRTIAFSFIIVFSVIVIAVALCVALLRLLDVYVFPDHQWASWAAPRRRQPRRRALRLALPPRGAHQVRALAVTEHAKLAVIGSGPAGLTAAIYAARAQLAPIVFEGEPSSTSDQPGGQLMLTTDVENFPGFIDGHHGSRPHGPACAPRRCASARTCASPRSTAPTSRPVAVLSLWFGARRRARPHRRRGDPRDRRAVDRRCRSPARTRLLGHGLSTCATCDGFFFRGQEIAVVGGGDSALEEAIFLTRFATKVTVVHRRDELRASRIMQERALANEKIEFRWNTVVDEVLGDESVARALGARHGHRRRRPLVDVTGVFVAIGHVPNTVARRGASSTSTRAATSSPPSRPATSIEGVFAAGDVQDHVYRQAITSAGSGCMAAIDAERWLESRGH